jgi:cysteine desulfurase/selenocysteine lyase
MLDPLSIRKDFPLYSREKRADFAYLDTASSSQTPVQVLDAMDAFYRRYRANVHRGMYHESEKATEQYEAVRRKVADWFRCKEEEVIFTRGTTESLNMIARMLSADLDSDDEVVITGMEHHANLVPWQQMAEERGFVLKHIPIKPDFTLDMDAARAMIGPKTKVVSATYASNVLGTVNPVRELTDLAHAQGAVFVVDAAQAAGHLPLDVQKLDCDFMAFSAHKMLGPTGVGVLYGKKKLLDALEPVAFGGDMIVEVRWDAATWNETPWKFEAGTPNIAGVIGLGAAIDYLKGTVPVNNFGAEVAAHEHKLVAYAFEKLASVPNLRIIGPTPDKPRVGVVSFVMDGVHPHDLATILDTEGVCVRAGHHCAMPMMRDLGLMDGAARASFGIYNDERDVEKLVAGLLKARKIFKL